MRSWSYQYLEWRCAGGGRKRGEIDEGASRLLLRGVLLTTPRLEEAVHHDTIRKGGNVNPSIGDSGRTKLRIAGQGITSWVHLAVPQFLAQIARVVGANNAGRDAPICVCQGVRGPKYGAARRTSVYRHGETATRHSGGFAWC